MPSQVRRVSLRSTGGRSDPGGSTRFATSAPATRHEPDRGPGGPATVGAIGVEGSPATSSGLHAARSANSPSVALRGSPVDGPVGRVHNPRRLSTCQGARRSPLSTRSMYSRVMRPWPVGDSSASPHISHLGGYVRPTRAGPRWVCSLSTGGKYSEQKLQRHGLDLAADIGAPRLPVDSLPSDSPQSLNGMWKIPPTRARGELSARRLPCEILAARSIREGDQMVLAQYR